MSAHISPVKVEGDRLAILDGWRAFSILSVMAGHLLPLDIIIPGLNEAAGATGMGVFFCLSGFLITRFLLIRPEVRPFLIRRALRIVPLAWFAVILLFLLQGSLGDGEALLANMFYYANLPPARLMEGGQHLWSLCVEAQFYLGVALLVALGGRRALFALPLFSLAITVARIIHGETISIITWFRLDEILAGATMALIWSDELGARAKRWLGAPNFYVLAAIMLVCCFFIREPLAYLRPYAIAATIGVTLSHAPRWLDALFTSRAAAYVAATSYALYVIHGMLVHTWLGSGDTLARYAKRPILFAATFALAHLSTYHFEHHFIELARRLTKRP